GRGVHRQLAEPLHDLDRIQLLLVHDVVHGRASEVLLGEHELFMGLLPAQVLGRLQPLGRAVEGIYTLGDGVEPVLLDITPAVLHVVPTLVLDRDETILCHVYGEDLVRALRAARLENEDGGCDPDVEKQVLRQLDNLVQTIVPQNVCNQTLGGLLKLLLGQDEGAHRAGSDVFEHILDNLHATELILVRRIHEHLRGIRLPNPFAGAVGACVHVDDVGFAVLVNQHVGASQGVDLPIELHAVELRLLDRLCLGGVRPTSFPHHIAHRLHQERARARTRIEDAVIHVDLKKAVHKARNVVRGENLTRFTLLLVAIELVEEYRYDVLAVPGAGG